MRRTFDTCFTLSLIYHLYVLFVWISYQARFGLKISYPAIVFTMVIGLLNCGSFIVHILLLGTSKVFTLSVFLPCACVHVLLPGTRSWYYCMYCKMNPPIKFLSLDDLSISSKFKPINIRSLLNHIDLLSIKYTYDVSLYLTDVTIIDRLSSRG